jgi:glycerol-3-phosphate dehydrogenase
MTPDCDVLVVGAGIHGAGVAQAAAAAGFTVTVLEQSAVAAGTSSRSSKLIHGGLRYLESARLRLVRESLAERARLLRLAPALIRLVPFHIPVYDDAARNPLLIRTGLSLYALLGGLGPAARFASLPRREWDALDGLDTKRLRAVFRYFDAQTDDAALTRAVMRSARQLGARLVCPGRFVAARRRQQGVEIDYHDGAAVRTLRARVLVNAAGPWANEVLRTITPAPTLRAVDLVQGAHIVLPASLAQGAYYLEAPDGRGVFVLPWQGQVLVGTTETAYTGDPAAVAPHPEEIEYLREAACRRFPSLTQAPVASFAGLRVLPRADTALFRRSREVMLDADDARTPRVLTIYGGKLTGYRLTAQRALACIAPALPASTGRIDTAALTLTAD